MPVQVIESIADLYCPREMKKATQNQYELCNAIDLKKKKKKQRKEKEKQTKVCLLWNDFRQCTVGITWHVITNK